MSRKPKYTIRQKIKASEDYLSSKKSMRQIAIELNMGKQGRELVRIWVEKYRSQGRSAFITNSKNKSYTKDFKEKIIKEYLRGESSIAALSIKYKISSQSTLRNWIMKYNNHIELKDYDPKPEVYMEDTLKTTYRQRIDIVKYCIEHDRDIKGTAAKYGCKYAQLYQWVRKYEANGEDALIDKRGKRKPTEELSDLEKAERKIARLEREKQEYQRKYELLKKAEEIERW